MLITKEEVIEALQKEQLAAGDWIEYWSRPDCHVCAVGAVLRKKGIPNSRISREAVRVTNEDSVCVASTQEALDAGHWLTALSRFFEQMIRSRLSYPRFFSEVKIEDREPTAEERVQLIEFVEKNLPNVFHIND